MDGELTAERDAVAIRTERRRLKRKGRGEMVAVMEKVEFEGKFRTRGEVDEVEDEVQYAINIAIGESWGGSPD